MKNIITDVDNFQGLFFLLSLTISWKMMRSTGKLIAMIALFGRLGVGLGLHFPLPQEVRFLIDLILYPVQVRRQADVDMAWRTYKILYKKINIDCTHESSLVWSLLCNILDSRWTILFCAGKWRAMCYELVSHSASFVQSLFPLFQC